jgi:hypothetical protein
MQNLLSSSLLSKNIKIKIYGTVILPFVLYECKACSLTFQAENMVLRKSTKCTRYELRYLYVFSAGTEQWYSLQSQLNGCIAHVFEAYKLFTTDAFHTFSSSVMIPPFDTNSRGECYCQSRQTNHVHINKAVHNETRTIWNEVIQPYFKLRP